MKKWKKVELVRVWLLDISLETVLLQMSDTEGVKE